MPGDEGDAQQQADRVGELDRRRLVEAEAREDALQVRLELAPDDVVGEPVEGGRADHRADQRDRPGAHRHVREAAQRPPRVDDAVLVDAQRATSARAG